MDSFQDDPQYKGMKYLVFGTMLYYMCVCFYYCRTYYKAVRGGGRRRVDDMCYDRRRAEACVDESAHHALANAGGREIVGKKGEQKGSARGCACRKRRRRNSPCMRVEVLTIAGRKEMF